jgi:hypothetical protein
MGSLMIRIVLAVVATTAVALFARAENVSAAELATAQGTISIAAAPTGMAAPRCADLIVEARDANDNHLMAQAHPALDADGACKYALSVPAQSAVWLHLREALVSSTGTVAPAAPNNAPVAKPGAPAVRAVQIRWTAISPNTYFFAPGEQKTIPLSY